MLQIKLKNLDDVSVQTMVWEARQKWSDSYLDKPFNVAILPADEKISLSALGYYWGVVLEDIADQTGYYPEEIHDFNKKHYGIKSTYFIGDEAAELIKGLSKMNKKQASQFVDRVIQHWREHGVIIRDPNTMDFGMAAEVSFSPRYDD